MDESGAVVHTIHVSLCLDKLLGRYTEAINALNKISISDDARTEFSNFITRLVKRDK